MNINLKLKKRREIINKEKSHQRTKIIRQYKQQMANDSDLNNSNYKDTNQKFEDFKSREEKRLNYEKQLYGEDINESDNEIINEKKEEDKLEEKKDVIKNKKENKEDKKFLGKKKTREEIEAEKQKKLNKRRKNYRNLHKTNKYGQPLMKYQIANLFDRIKKKKREGII